MTRALLPIALLALLVGCWGLPKVSDKIPYVGTASNEEALRVLRQRAAAVKTVSATGSVTLKRPGGDSVRLDLAMVSAPGHLRLRAWKLGRAVFDLTLTPDGLWLFTPEDPSMQGKARAGGLGAGQLARSWSTFTGGLFDAPDLHVENGERIDSYYSAAAHVRCAVDRARALPYSYQMNEGEADHEFSLTLSDYRLIGDLPFPFEYTANGPTGRIHIQLQEVELNTDLPEAAFVPPKRAEKLP